jgi:hypothetical protein
MSPGVRVPHQAFGLARMSRHVAAAPRQDDSQMLALTHGSRFGSRIECSAVIVDSVTSDRASTQAKTHRELRRTAGPPAWSSANVAALGSAWRRGGQREAIAAAVQRRLVDLLPQKLHKPVIGGGEPIRYADQIADQITMKLTGLAVGFGKHQTPPVACPVTVAAPQVCAVPDSLDRSVAAKMARLHIRRHNG